MPKAASRLKVKGADHSDCFMLIKDLAENSHLSTGFSIIGCFIASSKYTLSLLAYTVT